LASVIIAFVVCTNAIFGREGYIVMTARNAPTGDVQRRAVLSLNPFALVAHRCGTGSDLQDGLRVAGAMLREPDDSAFLQRAMT
jgi:hypothetical protein